MKKETEIKNIADVLNSEIETISLRNYEQSPAASAQFMSKARKLEIHNDILHEFNLEITQQLRIRFALFWAFLEGHSNETREIVEYNKIDFDFTKGILVLGSTGIGKTCVMRWFLELAKRFYGQKIRLSNAHDVVADFKQFGEAIIKKHGIGSFVNHAHRPIPDHSQPIHEYFDDLGVEENVVVYGQKTDVFKQIITDRHRMFLEQGLLTFATSNLTEKDLNERYGERVGSRIRQMFNIWNFTGNDLRKIK